MKKIHLYFLVLFVFLQACHSGVEKTILPRSNGKFNEVLLIINYKYWEGKPGAAFKKILQANIPGLPQPEPLFNVMQISPDNFSGSLRKNRNIIKVKVGEENEARYEKDLNASPQAYIFIQAKTEDDLVRLIEENANKIIDFIRDSDIGDIQRLAAKNAHTEKFKFFEKQNLKMTVPSDYDLIDDRDDFIWFRKRFLASNSINGSLNIFAYVYPEYIPYESLKDSVVALRNRMGKLYVPGPFEDSYLTTEAAYAPHIFPVEFLGKKAYKTLGKWEIYNDFQAGPFVNLSIPDSANHRTVIIEGLVFAPALNKRDMMFELEALIKTLKL